jgi:hypothetical protein
MPLLRKHPLYDCLEIEILFQERMMGLKKFRHKGWCYGAYRRGLESSLSLRELEEFDFILPAAQKICKEIVFDSLSANFFFSMFFLLSFNVSIAVCT